MDLKKFLELPATGDFRLLNKIDNKNWDKILLTGSFWSFQHYRFIIKNFLKIMKRLSERSLFFVLGIHPLF
jgi:hypothetical protein